MKLNERSQAVKITYTLHDSIQMVLSERQIIVTESIVLAKGWPGVGNRDSPQRGTRSFGGDENILNIMMVPIIQTTLISTFNL